MKTYFLAVDIGASSGRHILGTVEGGKMTLEEVYRFPNGMQRVDGHLVWDTEALLREIKAGMRACAALGKCPATMAIDTWAVDFVLLDKNDAPIGPAVAYRDERTDGMDAEVGRVLTGEALYRRTGIQKQPFNTIYQLMALQKQDPAALEKAESLLMIPDYFAYRLTGVKGQEYTNATTTALVDPKTRAWDTGLIELLGYPERLFGPLTLPGAAIGPLSAEVAAEVGFGCTVVAAATHDTASAVAAVPAVGDNVCYISSGTWSLMGTERLTADCREQSRQANFTNEGGVDFRYRYLKNIMGLWMIQSVQKELGQGRSFAELCTLAESETIGSFVDCNAPEFLAPASMADAVRLACRKTGQPVPETLGQLARVIYRSLAVCYRDALAELEELTGAHYDAIHIVGGGANADYLNRLTAAATGRTVLAGPGEATAIGNLLVQLRAAGLFDNLQAARRCVRDSFAVKTYPPVPAEETI